MNEMKSAKRLTALAVVLSTGVLGASSLSDINGHVCGFTGHWNHAGKEGQEIRVEVVTDCETAELVLNKRHLGDRPVDPKTHLATWSVPYEPGTLLARGKIDGRARIANTLVTAGEPKSLRLTPQNKAGEYLVSIIEATDADGVTSPFAANAFTASVTGPAALVAPADGKGRLVNGQSVVLVKRTGLGPVGVSVAADGLRGTAAEYGVEKPELTDKSFTFASYNVRAAIACDETPNRWDERAPRIVSVIERNGFDVVGIQEAERCWCEKLVSLLPGWRYCYQGRDENGEGESASFIWNAKRFQLVDTDTFWLSATPKTPGSKGVGSACPRTCMWVRLKDLRTGKEFLAFTTHLDFGHKAQFPQMKMIVEKVEELHAKTGLPAFFCGDLNMWAGRPAAEGETNSIVYAREHLKEMWDVSETPHQGNESSWSGFTPRPSRENQYRAPDGRIDHIFLTDGIRVLTSRTHDEYPDGLHPSDHHALSCDVELAPVAWSDPAEEAYAFRKRLECVHEKDRRDPAATCAADELEVKDGFSILLPKDASDFTYRVVRDFEDYLAVSMGVMSHVKRDQGSLRMSVDASLREREYRIEVDANGIRVSGQDERALAQAFYRLEDRMNLRGGPFLRHGIENRRPRFAVRMTHSGYRLSEFPDAHLSQMAHAGMTAIMLFLQDVDVIEGTRSCDVRALIRRAKGFGLDTYLYSCIPTFIHPDDGDAAFDESYGRIAGAYPEAKGLIIVGESCQFPSKDPRVQPVLWGKNDPKDKRPLAGWFPCTDYPDWVRAVQRALAKKAPDMKLVFWTYNWGWAPEKDRLALIDALPRNVVLQATFEMFERQMKRNGLESPTADYSLSLAGPGRYFATEAAAARKHGLTLFTQANAGGRTWDFGTAPYEPFPFQWRARWDALVRAHDDWGLSGIMENHHYGWTPTFIAELEKEAYTEGGLPFDEHIRRLAARDFGAANVDKAIAAWKAWSDAMRDYVPTDLNQYGPFRCGPAYPYAAGRGAVDAKGFPVTKQSLVGTGFIRMDYLKHGFVPELAKEDSSPGYMRKEIELLDSMIAAFESGARDFDRMKGAKAAAMGRLGHYLAAVCRTARNVKRGAVAESEKDEAAVLAAARDEYANATGALSLVEIDSHLGWEPEMDYVGGPDQIRWKLGLMEKLYGAEALK